jgi:xanthine/CO dehydrogenase XdhC/CoxF family maturation factor
MTSLTDIAAMLSLWSTDGGGGRRGAMATVVYVKGSAYRRPGARMLVTADGCSAGMISGGCLEDDVREHAGRVMASGEPRLFTYDTTSPADIVFGLGLGCNGVVKVLIEPVRQGDGSDLLTFFAMCHDRRQAGRIATVFASEDAPPAARLGARLLRWPDGTRTTNFDDPALRSMLHRALAATDGRRAAIRNLPLPDGGRIGVLLETIAPPVSLLVCGAGDDAIPLVQLAKQIGWHVTVADARPAYARPARFPAADAVICARPEDLAERSAIGPQTLAVIMTHSFIRDKELLGLLLPRPCRYIGILGPRVRTQRLVDELAQEGSHLDQASLQRIHGPAGLDIGAETPEEIAVAIIAEMRAVLGHRSGGPLRLRVGGIHEPLDEATVSE